MELKNNTILITGGTSGFGLEFTSQLLNLGNTVIITGRNQAKLDETKKRFPKVHTFQSDVSDPQAIAQLYEQVVKQFPDLNILINNAGEMRKINLLDVSVESKSITREIEINLSGPIRMMQQFLPHTGWSLMFHPDFIRNYPLGKNIKNYGFFSYAVNEALHLSDKEDSMIEALIKNIEQEYHSSIDNYSQDVMVSHVELLLNYANRFYNRQFITRKNVSNDLLVKLEDILTEYFGNDGTLHKRLPTVHYLSEQLYVSSNYLSDMLRTLTGQSAQQHIHNKLIEKAKEILTTTSLSVSEIAYQLGFEYPQSFNKLFKSKTKVSR